LKKNEVRNILAESTRISRTIVQPLNRLKVENFSCLFIPGGFGIAKNFSNFATATEMDEFVIDKEVERILKEFHSNKKPIGLCCMAPILAAKLFKGCTITLGDDTYKQKMADLGANLISTGAENVVIDKVNNLVSSPAYCISNAKPAQVHKGIGELVKSALNLKATGKVKTQESIEFVDSLLKHFTPEEAKK